MFCTCGSIIPEERIALGYINCIVCSEKQYVKPKECDVIELKLIMLSKFSGVFG